MEKENLIIFIVALIVLVAIAYFIYMNYNKPQSEKGGAQEGEILTPTPFSPVGRGDLIITEQQNEICGNTGPVVAF